MKNRVLIFVLLFSFAFNLNAQEKGENKTEKRIEVKVEKSDKDQKEAKMKIVVSQGDKVIYENEGNELDVKKDFKSKAADLGIESEIIVISSDDDMDTQKIMLGSKGQQKHVIVKMDTDSDKQNEENVFVIKGKSGDFNVGDGQNDIKWNVIKPGMDLRPRMGGVKIYDYNKKDKDINGFDVKKNKDINFETLNISIKAMGLISIRFGSEDKGEFTASLKGKDGEIVFSNYEKSFKGYFGMEIPVIGNEPGVYLLEIKIGKANLLKKVVIQ
jgi:hypothetical protein